MGYVCQWYDSSMGLFCSEAVALLLQIAGVLQRHPAFEPQLFTPADFVPNPLRHSKIVRAQS